MSQRDDCGDCPFALLFVDLFCHLGISRDAGFCALGVLAELLYYLGASSKSEVALFAADHRLLL